MAKDPLDDMLEELEGMDVDSTSSAPKTKREAVTQAMGDTGSSFKDAFKNNPLDRVGDVVDGAMPKGLSNEVDEAVNAKNLITDLYIKNAKDLKSSAKKTTELIKSKIPESGPFRTLVNKVDGLLKDDEAPSGNREPTEDEKVIRKLDEIFNKENKRSRVEAIITQTKEDNKFAQTAELHSRMLTELKLLNEFDNSQSLTYYTKSLELKFKSLYVAKQHLEITKSGFDIFKGQLESIVSNTGLPDIVKIRKSEQLSENINNRVREDITDMLYSNANPLTGLRDKLVAKVDGGMNKFKESLNTVNDAGEMVSGMEGGPSLGSMAGGYLAGMASKKAGSYATEMANKNATFRDKMFKFKMKTGNIKDTLEEEATDQLNKNTTVSRLASKVLKGISGMVDGDKNAGKAFTMEDPNDVSTFDNRTKNSINIIPEILNKIYGEVNAIRTKSPEVTKDMYFNHKTGRLEDKGGIGNSIKDMLGGKVAKYSGQEVNRLTDELSEQGGIALTKEEKTILGKEILGESIRNKSLTLKSLSKKEFLSKLPKELQIKTKKNLVRTAKAAKNDITLIDDFNHRLTSMKTNIPMVDRIIEEYFKSGQIETLLSTGLIVPGEQGGYIINEDKYIELVQSGVTNDSDSVVEEPVAEEPSLTSDLKKNLQEKFNNSILKKEAKNIDKIIKKKIQSVDVNKIKPKDIGKKAQDKLAEINSSLNNLKNEQLKDNKLLDNAIASVEQLKPTKFIGPAEPPSTLPTESVPKHIKYLEDINITSIKEQGKNKLNGMKNKYEPTVLEKLQNFKDNNKGLMAKSSDVVDNVNLAVMKSEDLAKLVEKNIKDGYGDSVNALKKVDTNTIKSGKAEGIKLLDTVKGRVDKAGSSLKDILNKNSISAEDLHRHYESSISAVKGVDFTSWASNLGFEFNGETFTKSEAASKLNTMKDSVKEKLLSQLSDMVDEEKDGPEVKGGKKSKLDYLSAILKKTRALDKKIFFSLPGIILAGLKGASSIVAGGLSLGGKSLGGAKDLLTTIITGNAPSKSESAKDKDTKKRSSNKINDIFKSFLNGDDKKKSFNDKDGDGDRDNGWKDRFQNMHKKGSKKDEKDSKGKSNKDTSKDKDNILSGILGMLTDGLPMLGGLVTALGGVAGVIKSVGGGLLKKAATLGASAIGAGGAATTAGAAAAATKGGSKNKASKAKKTNSKILKTLRSFKTTIIKKFGKSAGGKMVLILMRNIGKRIVPVVGLAVLAYDAAMIGKYMYDGLDFKSAVSKQILGFDLFDPYDPGLGDDGEPIEPDAPEVKGPAVTSGLDKDIQKEDERSKDQGIFSSVTEKISNYFSPNKTKQPGKFIDKSSNFFKTGKFKSTPKKEDIFNILESAAKKTGVDSNILKAFAGIESSFNPNAKAGTSSAKGLFQFINSTWRSMIDKYGSKYDLDPNVSPYDPTASALMGAEYIKENTRLLKSVKSDVGVTDLYLGHFLGPNGAKKLLSSDADDIAAGILPSAARANRGIFFDKSGRPRTVSEVYNTLDSRLATKAKKFGFMPSSIEEGVKSTAVNSSREAFLDNAKRVATQTSTVTSKPTSDSRKVILNGKELHGAEKERYIAKKELRVKNTKKRLARFNNTKSNSDQAVSEVNIGMEMLDIKPNSQQPISEVLAKKKLSDIKPNSQQPKTPSPITSTPIDHRPDINRLGVVLEESLNEHIKANNKLDMIVNALKNNNELLNSKLGEITSGQQQPLTLKQEEKGKQSKPVVDLRKKRYQAS